MFGLFKKDPIKKMENEYRVLSEKAVDAQRNGKIELYAELTFQAELIANKIDEIKKEHSKK
ncbi:MAG: Lacal_2735 family protein [Bacteriovoracaceae bacterium]|nr:Lacal_2735 family protein [Bacteriovoracaceae bacterium]